MDSECLNIAYHDDDLLWPQIFNFIQGSLPLCDLSFSSVPPMNGFSELPTITPKFIKHENAFWGEAFEDAFRKPYLWIYVLNYTSYETFKAKQKPQIRNLVNVMMEQRIEWLILFVHPLSTVLKTNHQSIFKSYEKVAQDLNSMSGMKQCVKLYCNKSKAFLCVDQGVDTYKSYAEEFMKAISRGVSIGIYYRMAFFLEEINKVEETKDFYLYFLMKEGLAITYSIAGLKRDAKGLYDEILSPPEIYLPIVFGEITVEELVRTSEISMSEFRALNKPMSHLYLRKYVFHCQQKLLEFDEDYIGIGHLSLNFVCTCLGLFKSLEETLEKYYGSVWVYNHSLELARYLQDKSKNLSDMEVKVVLHYSVGLMLSLVRSRLQILSRMKFNSYEIQMDLEPVSDFSLDRSPIKVEGRALKPKGDDLQKEALGHSDLGLESVLETQYRLEEALMIFTHSLYENFLEANYPKFAKRYKVEQGILLTSRGMHDQAITLLSSLQDIEWDTLQTVVLLNLLQCCLCTYKYNESVNVALKICKFSNILSNTTITKLWKCIEDISHINQNQLVNIEDLFLTEVTISNNKYLQGDIIEATCKVNNKIPCEILINRAFCQFASSRDNKGTLNLEANNLKLNPGTNTFKISGVACAQGKLKNSKIYLLMHKLTLVVKVNLTQIIIEENTKSVSLIHKVPSLLVFNEVQLLAIEISTRQYSIDTGTIVLSRETRILHNKSKAECISYTKEGKEYKKLEIQDFCIRLPFLPSHSRLYVILEIKTDRRIDKNDKEWSSEMISSVSFMKKHNDHRISSRHSLSNRLNEFCETVDFHADLEYNSNKIDSKEQSTSSLDYIFPLSVTSKFFKQENYVLLQLQILNCSHLSIQIISWEFFNCKIEEDPNTGLVLRTGQLFHMSFILSHITAPCKVLIKYSSSLRTHERKMHIDPEIDKKMKSQQFTMEHVFIEEEVATYLISEPVIIAQECTIFISLMNGSNAKARIEKSQNWAILSPVVQEFVDKCEVKLMPNKAGNLTVPEIIVWNGENAIKVEGPKKIFVSPAKTKNAN